MKRRRLAAVVSATLVVSAGAVGSAAAQHSAGAAPRAAAQPALVMYAPSHVVAYRYGSRGSVYASFEVQLASLRRSFELWSHRASYTDPITTEWRWGNKVTELPSGLMHDFTGLSDFFKVKVVDSAGKRVYLHSSSACLNSYDSARIVPNGAAHSPYPTDCPYNIFTVGSVQGIARGWAAGTYPLGYRPLHLALGKYTVHLAVAPIYRKLFSMPLRNALRTITMTVRKPPKGGPGIGAWRHRNAPQTTSHPLAAPHRPSGAATAPPAGGPEPDLVSAPAWGIQVSKDGNYLQFSATVWNAGNSPLVVDGFREKNKPIMDAYQYFYDADGNQTGYVPAGHMEWDPRPTHMHWHFEDFARYRLLDANQKGVERSQKEAFCLAATDAMDYTVPGADWNPQNTDLRTACGDFSARSVSEVLASGSGDTYEQFRAGQSFSLKNLPNGTYYIAVEANPNHVLTEQSTTNNTALREVIIGGTPGARTVEVPPVGDISG